MELPCQWFLFFLCWENFYHKTSLSVIFSFVGKISIIKISPLCYLFFLIIFQGFKTEKCLTSPFTLEIFIKSMWAKMFLVKESSSLQLFSRVQPFSTPWTAARHASLSIINSQSLPKLMCIESVMPSNHLILCHLLPLLPSTFPISGSFLISQFFTSGGQSIGASASVFPMNVHDWFPLGLTGLISL